MNQIISKIKEQIQKNKEIIILEEDDTSITVKPRNENSFPVSMLVKYNKFWVYFKGWNEGFYSEEEALDYFAFGLSDNCRLKVITVGEVEYKWILECKEDGQWVEESIQGIPLFPFWEKNDIVYYQNKIKSL